MHLLLHNIRSIHNVGSIFRTADALGVKKIYLAGITPAPIDRFGREVTKLTKVSLGAENTVAWEQVKSPQRLAKLLKQLKAEGYRMYAVEQHKKSVPFNAPTQFRLRKLADEVDPVSSWPVVG